MREGSLPMQTRKLDDSGTAQRANIMAQITGNW